MLKLLVTGCTGMLGSEIAARLEDKFHIFGCGRENGKSHGNFINFDLCSASYETLKRFCDPDVIINCAALADHEKCEEVPDYAMLINGLTPEKLAKAFPSAYIIQVSTDAVFGDDSHCPDEDGIPVPKSAYGISKLAGERLLLNNCENALVLRTTLVGTGGKRLKPSLAEWIISSLKNGIEINLFIDALFTPINTLDFVDVLDWCILTRPKGILHAAGSEIISKYAFGTALAKHCHLDSRYIKMGRLNETQFFSSRCLNQSLNSAKIEGMMKKKMPNLEECVRGMARRLECLK